LPENFINTIEVDSAKQFIDVELDVSCPEFTKNSEVVNKLKAVIELINNLELNGARCKLSIVCNTTTIKADYNIDFKVTIKDYDDIMPMEQVAFLAATPVVLRYYLLLLSSTVNGDYYYGSMYTDAKKEQSERINKAREGVLYIPSIYYDIANKININDGILNTYPHLESFKQQFKINS
jgi:hypothetical protein